MGKLTEAEELMRDAVVARREVLGDKHKESFDSIESLGLLLQDQGKLTEAVRRAATPAEHAPP